MYSFIQVAKTVNDTNKFVIKFESCQRKCVWICPVSLFSTILGKRCLALSSTISYGFKAPCQNLEKTKDTIARNFKIIRHFNYYDYGKVYDIVSHKCCYFQDFPIFQQIVQMHVKSALKFMLN